LFVSFSFFTFNNLSWGLFKGSRFRTILVFLSVFADGWGLDREISRLLVLELMSRTEVDLIPLAIPEEGVSTRP